MNLIDSLIKNGWLKKPNIIEAFRKIKRADFLPEDNKELAEANEALPIGFSQTISQPQVVAFMLELLDPKKGDKILDVGSGSAWTTALLGEIVRGKNLPAGRQGKVIAVDIVPELVDFGRQNAEKYSLVKKGIVEFICADGSKGYKKEAPYDKILASATAREIPPAWKEQIKIGGRIVLPINFSIWRFTRKSAAEFETKEYPGFVFVPLISK